MGLSVHSPINTNLYLCIQEKLNKVQMLICGQLSVFSVLPLFCPFMLHSQCSVVPLDGCITDPSVSAEEGVQRGSRYYMKCKIFQLAVT